MVRQTDPCQAWPFQKTDLGNQEIKLFSGGKTCQDLLTKHELRLCLFLLK